MLVGPAVDVIVQGGGQSGSENPDRVADLMIPQAPPLLVLADRRSDRGTTDQVFDDGPFVVDVGAGAERRGDGSIEAVERVFATNFFGTLRVTQAMLPWLARSERARIVNVSSGLGSLAHNNDPAWEHGAFRQIGFNASKAALNMLTVQLSHTLRETSITVNSVDPGAPADLAVDASGKRVRQGMADGARSVLMLALGERGPVTGGFYGGEGPLPW